MAPSYDPTAQPYDEPNRHVDKMDDKTRALVGRLRNFTENMHDHYAAADTIEAQAARIEQLEEMCRALAGKDK